MFYLWIDADDFSALVAVVGEHVLVALDAVGVIVAKHVPVAGQGVVAVVAKHLLLVKCLLAVIIFDRTERKKIANVLVLSFVNLNVSWNLTKKSGHLWMIF
jgi:hypothetical protein